MPFEIMKPRYPTYDSETLIGNHITPPPYPHPFPPLPSPGKWM